MAPVPVEVAVVAAPVPVTGVAVSTPCGGARIAANLLCSASSLLIATGSLPDALRDAIVAAFSATSASNSCSSAVIRLLVSALRSQCLTFSSPVRLFCRLV